MKVAAFIPARLDSRRFPGKLLKDLGGKPVIIRTWQSATQTGLFDEIYIVTDSPEIAGVCEEEGAKVLISRKNHFTGTDRIAEFAGKTLADIIINIQGDEPFIRKEPLEKIIEEFSRDNDKKIDIISLMQPIETEEEFLSPDNVKVVVDKDNFAMYFSRSPIPYHRDISFSKAWKHIGIYAFRKNILEKIATLPHTDLEKLEKLENLRFLQYGLRIKMLPVKSGFIGIDTPEDLKKARKMYNHARNKA